MHLWPVAPALYFLLPRAASSKPEPRELWVQTHTHLLELRAKTVTANPDRTAFTQQPDLKLTAVTTARMRTMATAPTSPRSSSATTSECGSPALILRALTQSSKYIDSHLKP